MQYPLITAAPERESRIKERLDKRTIDKGVDIVETGTTGLVFLQGLVGIAGVTTDIFVSFLFEATKQS